MKKSSGHGYATPKTSSSLGNVQFTFALRHFPKNIRFGQQNDHTLTLHARKRAKH